MGWFSKLRRRYDALVARYGRIAIATYFTLFFGALFGFWGAISSGVDVAAAFQHLGLDASGATSRTGTLLVAYGFTKLTQPLRIVATLALTPLVARVLGRAPLPIPAAPEVEPVEPA